MSSFRWIGAYHWTKGRGGNTITGVVIHWMSGTLASTDATFLAGVREASAHYGVEDGTVHGYVRTSDTAWAVGDWAGNQRTISIEVSAEPGRDASPETLQTVIELVTDLCRDHGLTADHIYKHSDYIATQCPGTVPVDYIRQQVTNRLKGIEQDDDMALTLKELQQIQGYANENGDRVIADFRAQLAAVARLIAPDIDENELAAALLAQGTVTITK